MNDWKVVLQIFLSFLKIGPISFGGGYAMIPIIEREVVVKRKWVRSQDIADVFAIAQSAPGAIAINTAIFVGYRIAGIKGGIAALIGVLLPTFSIILILSVTFLHVQDYPVVNAAFHGISAAVVALIVYAGYKIGQTAVYDKTTLSTVGITVFILFFFEIHPILIILLGIIVGILQVKVKDMMGLATKLDNNDNLDDDPNYSNLKDVGS